MDKSVSVLYEPEYKTIPYSVVSPHSITPWSLPHHAGGKKPKCFFAMLKSFIGASLMGFGAEPDKVYQLLTSNLSFARVCGFIPEDKDKSYGYKPIPSQRKLEQFDQIMREYGLWNRVKWDEIRGMEKLTPYGELICRGGVSMDYQGMRYESEKFIYQPPLNENGVNVCVQCAHKPICSPVSNKCRVVTIPFDMLPHIDPDDPPMAKRFKAMMTHRPCVERMIKRLKCDLSDDRLTKRGNDSFQAYLDKTMIAFHILLRNSSLK